MAQARPACATGVVCSARLERAKTVMKRKMPGAVSAANGAWSEPKPKRKCQNEMPKRHSGSPEGYNKSIVILVVLLSGKYSWSNYSDCSSTVNTSDRTIGSAVISPRKNYKGLDSRQRRI